MSHPAALEKLLRAARLSAEAARLYAEAAQELSRSDQAEGEPDGCTPPSVVPPVTEVDQARARRALRRAGARI
jgi:hypothetical protein